MILSLKCSQKALVDLWATFDAGVKKGKGGLTQYMELQEIGDLHQLIGHWKATISALAAQDDEEEEVSEVDELVDDDPSDAGTRKLRKVSSPKEFIIRDIPCNSCRKIGQDCRDAIKQENEKKGPGRASKACEYCKVVHGCCETGSPEEVRHYLNMLPVNVS